MGTTTFLFTDIEGSTRLWEAHPEAMKAALAGHDSITLTEVEGHGGRVFKHMGDGAIAAFPEPSKALAAAQAIRAALAASSFPDVGSLKVRIGIHTGEAEERDGDYFGPTLNRGARVMAAGHGGQVLLSESTTRLVGESGLQDLGEHRLKDLSAPEHLFQVASDSEFPPLRTLDVDRTNLPVLGTSFVGREREIDEAADRLASTRLLTITGVGGAGKTRLALQLAADTEHRFPEGAWLVELGAVTDPDLVAAAFAEGLRVTQSDDQDLRSKVVDFVRGGAFVVVVDNCEHLIDEVAHIVEELMAASPDSSFIATSRELLGVPGESAFALRSMSLPARSETPGPDELLEFDAVRLFEERARAADRRFTIGEDNAVHVLEICRRLDGMPLAIELAAARVRAFAPERIAELLDQRFRLLTGGSRTALPRQQTLAATIEWSYRLLDETERLVFDRLAVFQGGFTYDAVSAVVSGGEISEFDILELLPSLVDKSLIVAEEASTDVRYHLLETIRQFARERFDDHPDANDYRLAHARFFEQLSQEAGRNIRGPDERLWWERIDTELDNLRAAMTWALEHDDAPLALSVVTGFWRFWWFKGRWEEGAGWIGRILDAEGHDTRSIPFANGLLAYGSLSEWSRGSRRRDGVEALDQAIEIYERERTGGNPSHALAEDYAAALINRGVLADIDGNPEMTYDLMRQALEVGREAQILSVIAVTLGNLANIAIEAGDFDGARQLQDEGLEVAEQLGSNQRLMDAWWQRSELELHAGEATAAAGALDRAARYAMSAGLDHAEASHLLLAEAIRVHAGVGDGATLRVRLEAMRAFPNYVRTGAFQTSLMICRLVLDVEEGSFEKSSTRIALTRRHVAPGTPQAYWLATVDALEASVREAVGDAEVDRAADQLGTPSREEVASLILD